MDRGLLIIVSGFSGAGKGSIVKKLLSKYDNYALSISATTRQPRNGETDGKEYFFVSKETFEKKISEDGLIEFAQYVGNYYGTPKEYVEKMLSEGKDVILEIEMQGALKVKFKMPDTITVFVSTKDSDTLKKRLNGRGTETLEQIDKRLSRAVEEADFINQYDYLLINDNLDQAVDELHNIICSEHKRVKFNTDFIEKIQKDLKANYGIV